MKHYYSIAIDGPAASGKSTAAKAVAQKLNFLYVDTGAMYRAFTLLMLEKGMDCKNREEAKSLLDGLEIEEDEKGHIYLFGKDVSGRVREDDVSQNVSFACAHLEVREKMVDLQRKMASSHSVCMDGRDIGTVVLPDATLKIFQVASVEARAQRRYQENLEKGYSTASIEEIKKDIQRRDEIDSTRANSPLKQASDAVLLDTSSMSIEEEIDAILALFRKRVGEETWKHLVQSH